MLAQRDWEEKAIVQEMRQEQRKREMWLRYATTVAVNKRHAFAREVQAKARHRVSRLFGLDARPTTHKCPFDLWIEGVRVEVKGSHWQKNAQRYQADVRGYEADVILFDAINGTDHWFVIPINVFKPRRKIEVYSYHVESYAGQWAVFLEAWDVLEEIIKYTSEKAVQLSLPKV